MSHGAVPAGGLPGSAMSVLLVNWNSREDTLQCLASLEAQGASADGCEVILVDNGSHDGSVEAVQARFPRTVVVAAGENLGFAEGCNRGIAVATRPWVFTLNNDAELEPGGLGRLRRELEGLAPTVAALQPSLVFRDRPDTLNSTGVEVRRNGCPRDRSFDAPRARDRSTRDVFCPTAGAAVYRRAALDQVALSSGVFDRTFFMYYEDVDLGWRLRLAGWSTEYVPDVTVLHAFHGSSQRRGRTFVDEHCRRNRLRMLLKDASGALLARSLGRSLGDVLRLARLRGRALGSDLARVVADGHGQRPEVEARRTVDRAALEERWFLDP